MSAQSKMQIIPVILSGGLGTRLWPLSRKQYPKQYIPLVGDKTMLQETILRLSRLDNILDPIIICNSDHRFIVAEQCNKIGIKNRTILLEPFGRNTAPAITASAIQSTKATKNAILLVLSADHIIHDVKAFHQAIKAPLIKSGSIGKTGKYKNVDYELKQLVSESLVGDGVADVFKIAGLESPDISILSDEFLAEVKKMPQKNLAVELLQKLMKDEMKTRFKNNIVKQKQFSELLQNALDKYSNRAIEAAQVIEELIKMAKEFKKDLDKAKEMNLNESEVAFYDALSDNNSAKELMGDELLVKIAKEVAEKLRSNLTVDWSVRESVRARLRLIIKNLLRKYKYPPDEQISATELILRQAETISEEWAVN